MQATMPGNGRAYRQVAAAEEAAGAGVGLAQLVAQRRQLGLLRRQQRLQLRRLALRAPAAQPIESLFKGQ